MDASQRTWRAGIGTYLVIMAGSTILGGSAGWLAFSGSDRIYDENVMMWTSILSGAGLGLIICGVVRARSGPMTRSPLAARTLGVAALGLWLVLGLVSPGPIYECRGVSYHDASGKPVTSNSCKRGSFLTSTRFWVLTPWAIAAAVTGLTVYERRRHARRVVPAPDQG